MKKPDIYIIKWHDAQSEDDWTLYNKHNNKISPMVIQTVGYLINKNKLYIKVAASWGCNRDGTNMQYNGTMSIPIKSILTKRKLI